MQSVQLRSRVAMLAKSNPPEALQIARTITHPWYRCQALCSVAGYQPKQAAEATLMEAIVSAAECHDVNRRVEVACWPLETALAIENKLVAKQAIALCKHELAKESDPISKWAAFSVTYRIRHHPELLDDFYPTFVSATKEGHGWRVERMIAILLDDADVRKNTNYINYLEARRAAIMSWKKNKKLTRQCSGIRPFDHLSPCLANAERP